ncbi:MAG: AAA ATPase domain [Halomonas sp. HL-48]|nr:AAA family ATPase [Halomonas sp. HL-48]KPQ23990.1 MAG: AAA ATPase domain [Halomonas sp. HL-48]
MRDANKYDQLTLFGHFALSQGDDVLTHFSYDKVKALLVYLLLHRQPVNRAALAELLWPDQGLSSGRTNLRHALHCLRQSLGEDAEQVLNVSRQTIAFQLPANWQVDLHELQALLEGPRDLETLNAVLTCYQGDLIEELQLANCSEFQRWLVQARNEWRQRVIRFAEHVLDNHQDVPDGLLETLVSRFSGYGPFHERLVKQLAEQKQMAAAHEQYNSYLQLLALSGQQPEPSFLQLASYWSDGHPDARAMSPQGAFSRALATDSKPLREDEIELRQLSVMAIRLRLQGDWQDRAAARNCLALQLELLRWLEQQCHHLGGFWLPGATGGLGLACFGTHGPAHQLAELVALYEHCRQTLPQESSRHWSGEGEPPQFELAAGLHSGRVVYLPERQLADPLGQVTQISVELMSAAEGSELVISQESSQHMPPALDLQPRLVSRVLASDGRVRQRALVLGQNEGGRDAMPPSLVGRETSLRTLRDALARAGIGLRQSVLVRGASGMGKSALMVGFRQLELSRDAAICWQPTTRLSVLEPYGVARTLLAWYLERTPDVDALHDLQAELAFNSLRDEQQSLLEEALGVRSVQEVSQLTQNGEAVELVVMLLHRLIERQAATHTLVLMIDDLQWLDEPSFKVLSGLQARLPINTAFMLVASHHGREPLPVKLHWDQQITLGRLDALQSSRLLSQLSRRYRIHLSPRLRNQIIERCDGVPLYMQEICRRLDMDRREGRSVQFDELPKGLLGLLASRIDQLEGDRDIAHIAAVLGKRFRLDFLKECSGYDTTRLQQALEHMRQLEIIEPVDNGTSELEFQFSHQLLQEAAYLSCPRDVRVTLHQQVVSLIEERFPMWISRHPGDFATHLRRSGHYARGARYFELAAREALKVSANRTALRMADFGLASLRHVEHEIEREVSLLTVRGQAAFALEGHGSPTAHESFVRARELLRQSETHPEDPEDLEQIFLVKWGLWVGRSQRYAHADAFALASTLADIAARLDDPRYQRLADYARAHCEYWAGRIQQAHDHLNEIDPLNAPMMIEWLPFSDHPQVTAACFQGWALCLRGDYQRAERQVSAAIRLAEKLGHPGTLAMALLFAASLYRQLGHVHLAARHAEKAAAMTATPDLQLWQISAQGILGWQRALAGDQGGLTQLRDSLDQMAELNGRDRFQRPVLWYSDACIALGELTAAEDYLDQCLVIAKERTTLFLPELATQLARVRIMLDHPANEVRALAEMAISQAREHGNRHQELAALELWLTRIAPEDERAREAFHHLLGDVSHSDAPVLVRWVSLLDHRLTHPERLES